MTIVALVGLHLKHLRRSKFICVSLVSSARPTRNSHITTGLLAALCSVPAFCLPEPLIRIVQYPIRSLLRGCPLQAERLLRPHRSLL